MGLKNVSLALLAPGCCYRVRVAKTKKARMVSAYLHGQGLQLGPQEAASPILDTGNSLGRGDELCYP